MASKFIVLATILAACSAVPVWFNGNEPLPGVIMRIGRSPSIAHGLGSSYSANIGGISQSTSYGTSLQSGDGQAYGYGAANDGSYSRSVGLASTGNSYPVHYTIYPTASGNSYGSAKSSAFNNYGNALSSAYTQSGGPAPINSAVSTAHNNNGYGSTYSLANAGPALSLARNDGHGSVATSQTRGLGNNLAVSAAQNIGGIKTSNAYTYQQNPTGIQHSNAISIDGNGYHSNQAHAVNEGYY